MCRPKRRMCRPKRRRDCQRFGNETTVARRMVLASGFRGRGLRLPLSRLVRSEIATATLELEAFGIEIGIRHIKRREHQTLSLAEAAVSNIHSELPQQSRISARYLLLRDGDLQRSFEIGHADIWSIKSLSSCSGAAFKW